MKLPLKVDVRRFDGGQGLELHEGTVHPVLAVAQLQELAVGVPHGSIVVYHQPLHGLDQPTLDVPWGTSDIHRVTLSLS